MKNTIIFMLLLLPVGLKAQSSIKVDSFMNVLNTPGATDDEKIMAYRKISSYYVFRDVEKCIEYATKGLEYGEKSSDKLSLCVIYNSLGLAYSTLAKNDTALMYLEKGIDIAKSIDAKEVEADMLSAIGTLYKDREKYTQAIEYYLKSLPISESIGDRYGCCSTLINLGVIHYALKNMDRAIYYLEQAKEIAEEINKNYLKAGVYHALGHISRDQKNTEEARDYYEKSLEFSRKANDKQFEILSLLSLAGVYTDYFKDYEKALEYIHELVPLAQAFGHPGLIVASWIRLSDINFEQKNYKESEKAAFNGWAIDSTSQNEAAKLAYNIATANIYLGNKDKAMEFLGKYHKLRDQYAEKSSHEAFADMEIKYETEKKETRIAVLEKERKLYIWLGISVAIALLLAIGLLFYRHRLSIQNRKVAEQQIKQLKYEKDFIAIQSSLKAEKAERDLIAHDLHDSVSSLLTVVKNNMNLYADSEHKEITFYNNAFEVLSKSITELRRVVYHLKSFILTKEGLVAALDDFCRFIPNAEFHFKGLNHRFDPDKEYVLYDCACELINNALKHSGASRIDVHLNMDEDTVYLSVADNGTGFDSQEINPGIGLDNIRSNLSAFGGHLEILSEPDKGTEANVEMEI